MTTPIGSTRAMFARHAAAGEGPHMGLAPMPPQTWIQVDHQLAKTTARKRHLLKTAPGRVFQSLDDTRDGQAQVRDMLVEYLPSRYPGLYAVNAGVLETAWNGCRYDLTDEVMPPLVMASHWVQEDLCLLRETNQGFCLAAGCVCSPTYWSLPDKLGLPLRDVHRPVPGYAAKIADRVDRVLKSLRVDRPIWRTNWNISDSPKFFQPKSQREPATLSTAQVGERLFLRVERQTLRRLAGSRDIVFTIRVHIDPISVLASHPVLARTLRNNILSLNDEQLAYKGLRSVRSPLLDYLNHFCIQA